MHAHDGRIDLMNKDLASGLRAVGAIMVFSSIGLAIMAFPISRVFAGEYPALVALGNVVIAMMIGLVPFSLLHLLPTTPRLYPVGRLDKDSRGLLLLTNDGELTHKLMHPSFAHSKTYHVQLERAFTDEFIKLMASGVKYKEVDTLPCKVRRLSEDKFEIVLIQGLNRQIRRMSSALGYKVIDLQRVALMTLSLETVSEDNCTESKAATNTLNTLPEGEMRPLTPTEITTLKAALAI